MTNGKNKVSIGCEYGRTTRLLEQEDRADVNNMGKKLDRIQWFMVVTSIAATVDIIVRVTIK
jgi:hypothetical protein